MSDETQNQAPKTPEEAPNVTVNDLANVYAVIDLASKRGAFQANELAAVGSVANKVKAFVDHVQAQQAEANKDKEGKEGEAPAGEAPAQAPAEGAGGK